MVLFAACDAWPRMSIHGIHHDAMTAQAQYAEWLRRLQAETRAKLALKSDEAEAERETTSSDESEGDSEEPEGEPSPDSPPEDDGHLRSFA